MNESAMLKNSLMEVRDTKCELRENCHHGETVSSMTLTYILATAGTKSTLSFRDFQQM